MRWRKAPTKIKPATRIKKRFLWWPKKIGEETRWLEIAEWKEQWIEYDYCKSGYYEAIGWIND